MTSASNGAEYRCFITDANGDMGSTRIATGMRALEVILAIYKSQKTGNKVQLPLTDFASTDMDGMFR